ncbi:MAG: hypothetical protein LCI02_11125 [Proteobacteria bacterium]|nr:hypothetical protein [Pseudomonadota bacterium]
MEGFEGRSNGWIGRDSLSPRPLVAKLSNCLLGLTLFHFESSFLRLANVSDAPERMNPSLANAFTDRHCPPLFFLRAAR